MPINTTPIQRNRFVFLITGENGGGKTTFAASFPSPYCIFTESANGPLTPHKWGARDVAKTLKEVNEAIDQFENEKHDFKTLVIDGLNGLSGISVMDVFARNPDKPALAECDGGYGKGQYSAAVATARIARRVQSLTNKFNVVLTAVTSPQDVELPGLPVFQCWQMNLLSHKDCDPNVVFRTDCDYHFHIFGKPTGNIDDRAALGASNMAFHIGTRRTPTYHAKQRTDLPPVIPFDDKQASTFWSEMAKSLANNKPKTEEKIPS
jgi:AAA domain